MRVIARNVLAAFWDKHRETKVSLERWYLLTKAAHWTSMDIRPIRTDEDHRAALEQIDACWGAPEGSEEGDKLDVLVALVQSYEARRWPIEVDGNFDPIDVMHYAIDELGHMQTEFADLLGSRSRASEILSRRRALTVDMIHKISEAWKIPADLLVRPYRIDTAAKNAVVW